MDIFTTIVYIILFIIMMVFVFSIGMLKPFMDKKETALVLICGFVIGGLGGAFFLSPIYDDVPDVVSTLERTVPSNEETLYLDFSSAISIDDLESNLTSIEGVRSFNVTGITFNLWQFEDDEQAYLERTIGNINSHYVNWSVNSSGTIDIDIEDGYDVSEALRSFSDWYRLVYGETIAYAQVHAVLVVQSSSLDEVEDLLLQRGIVPTESHGPVSDSIERTNASMLSYNEFICATGIFGVIVAIFGIYFDTVVVGFRKLKKFINTRIKR